MSYQPESQGLADTGPQTTMPPAVDAASSRNIMQPRRRATAARSTSTGYADRPGEDDDGRFPVLLRLPEIATVTPRTKWSRRVESTDSSPQQRRQRAAATGWRPKEAMALLNDFWNSGSGKIIIGGLAVCVLLIAVSVMRRPAGTTPTDDDSEPPAAHEMLFTADHEPESPLWPDDSRPLPGPQANSPAGTLSGAPPHDVPIYRQAANVESGPTGLGQPVLSPGPQTSTNAPTHSQDGFPAYSTDRAVYRDRPPAAPATSSAQGYPDTQAPASGDSRQQLPTYPVYPRTTHPQ